MSFLKYTLALFTISALLISCGEEKEPKEDMQDEGHAHEHVESQNIEKAIAVLYPTEGSEVNGQVEFVPMMDGRMRVTAEVYNLTPGKHGFHIHEYGNCSAADGTSAGGHYHKTHDQHGSREEFETHIGDLGNLEADEEGIAKLTFITDKITFEGERNILGRGIIVHAGEDDLKTQPTGGAGARVACGVIGVNQK